MARDFLRLFLMLSLVVSPEVLLAQASPVDPEVTKGVKLVDEGDYDGAILTLDNAARRLAATAGQTAELSRAYVYLGVAYVGKGHEAAAKAKFREAIAGIKDLTLSPDKFPPKVIDLFEAARQESAKAPATAQVAPESKGGSKKGLWIGLGAAAAVGVGVAVAVGGKKDSGPIDPRTVENFTGTLCGYDGACANDRCYDIVVAAAGTLEATATWTDPSMVFTMNLDDKDYQSVARSNRVTNTSSTMTSAVTPQTGCGSCSYHLCVFREDRLGSGNFNLTVKHP